MNTRMIKASTFYNDIGISNSTLKKLEKKDDNFPSPTRIGRENYFSKEDLQNWLATRASNPEEFKHDDRVISGVKFLELIDRSRGWLWLNVIKTGKLTRLNLSPDPGTNKLVNFFIEREVYAAFGDLIEVAKGETA